MLTNQIMNKIEYPTGLAVYDRSYEDSNIVKMEEIINLTMTKRVPLCESASLDKIVIWVTEPGRSQMISRMAQRWIREGKDVIVISDRTLPLPEGVVFHLVEEGAQGILASGLLNSLINTCHCHGEEIFETETMYAAYKELLKYYTPEYLCTKTGLTEYEVSDLSQIITKGQSVGFFFPHEEMQLDRIQSFRTAFMIPLVLQGCNRTLSLSVIFGNGRQQVAGTRRHTKESLNRFQSIQNIKNKERSGKMTFAFYVSEIADRFEIDPFPLG